MSNELSEYAQEIFQQLPDFSDNTKLRWAMLPKKDVSKEEGDKNELFVINALIALLEKKRDSLLSLPVRYKKRIALIGALKQHNFAMLSSLKELPAFHEFDDQKSRKFVVDMLYEYAAANKRIEEQTLPPKKRKRSEEKKKC